MLRSDKTSVGLHAHIFFPPCTSMRTVLHLRVLKTTQGSSMAVNWCCWHLGDIVRRTRSFVNARHESVCSPTCLTPWFMLTLSLSPPLSLSRVLDPAKRERMYSTRCSGIPALEAARNIDPCETESNALMTSRKARLMAWQHSFL